MKPDTRKISIAKKPAARKKVVDAHEELDSQLTVKEEEFRQKVACKAYELFAARGYLHGYDVQDWQEAERLIRKNK